MVDPAAGSLLMPHAAWIPCAALPRCFACGVRVLLVRVASCVVTDNKNVGIVMGVIGTKIVEVISGVGPGWA